MRKQSKDAVHLIKPSILATQSRRISRHRGRRRCGQLVEVDFLGLAVILVGLMPPSIPECEGVGVVDRVALANKAQTRRLCALRPRL